MCGLEIQAGCLVDINHIKWPARSFPFVLGGHRALHRGLEIEVVRVADGA